MFVKNNRILLTNFFPLVVTSFLRKGEKEKTFVKVSKVLRRIKKTSILNDTFLINKKIFMHKILYLGKRKEYLLKNLDNNLFKFDLFNKSRFEIDFIIKSRIFSFLTNLYPLDNKEYFRYITKLNINKYVKKSLLKKKKISVRYIIKKKKFKFLCLNFFKKSNFGLTIFKQNKDVLNKDKFNNFHLEFLNLKLLLDKVLKKKNLVIFFLNKYFKNYLTIKNSLKLNIFLLSNYKTFLSLNFCKILFNFKAVFKLNKKNKLDSIAYKNLKKIKINFFQKVKEEKKPFIKKRRYYYISKETKILQREHKSLDQKFNKLKKIGKRMPRFEFKKRKFLFEKLNRAYRNSRISFFKFKKKKLRILNKKLFHKKKEILDKTVFNNTGLKIFFINKKNENISKKKITRLKFFKYSNLISLFSPIKFLNIILSAYRLHFTLKEQRFWGKQRLIPTIIDPQRDIRMTIKNFKKTISERIFNINFDNSIFEEILYAGSKKGLLLKLKKRSYIFMLKNIIFLQFMRRRKNASKRRRRKKIDKK